MYVMCVHTGMLSFSGLVVLSEKKQDICTAHSAGDACNPCGCEL